QYCPDETNEKGTKGETMKTIQSSTRLRLTVLACLILISQHAAAQIPQEKQYVLDWLSEPEVVARFGAISDAIWSYAELGLQEYKSSALLTKTLEAEGFRVERGLADMPTCFVASYGSGKPVIGILAEYDALPMISQKPRVPTQQPVVAGAPGHGCGHNLMGTAAVAAAIAVNRPPRRCSSAVPIWYAPDYSRVSTRLSTTTPVQDSTQATGSRAAPCTLSYSHSRARPLTVAATPGADAVPSMRWRS
ncbi:MAG: hypothetical protein ACYTBS_21825, partial [Planctomycetota bacterium]